MTNPQETVDRLGLKIRAQFVPFSQSRNRDQKDHSLNWRVTLVRVHSADNEAGRDILATDYSAGMGHCPSYKQHWGKRDHAAQLTDAACRMECETGYPMNHHEFTGRSIDDPASWSKRYKAGPIMPKDLDVIASLVLDSDVLDESSFEDWASSLGYDPDSRKAESTYRACLEIALKLRNALGETALAELREAFADY